MRRKIVAGNWKMNKTLEEAQSLFQAIIEGINEIELEGHKKIIIAPPSIYLNAFKKDVTNQPFIHLAAQNCHQKSSGAYTGELSASMFKSIGIDYVIIGHSERRSYFNETDQMLAAKVKAVLNEKQSPIFCCGESLEIRQSGKYVAFIKSQLENGLFHLNEVEFRNCIIAYEPIWAIGTGETASPEQAQEVHAAIRNMIQERYGSGIAEKTTILYGGSCKPSNAQNLFEQQDVDGGLIGGASLQAADFLSILKAL